MVRGNQCLLTKNVIKLDKNCDEFIGGQETKILTSKDLVEVCKVLENERSTRATSMNCASSRSHAIVEMRLRQRWQRCCARTRREHSGEETKTLSQTDYRLGLFG